VFLMGLTQGKHLQRAVAADGLPIRSSNPEAIALYYRTTFLNHRHIQYMIVKGDMSRDTAEEDCKLLRGTLATPSTYDEFDWLDRHMEEQGWYHLGAQCKNCTSVEDDKWEWSTGEKLSLQFGKWGYDWNRKFPFDDGSEDAIYLFAVKPKGSCALKFCQARILNLNGKGERFWSKWSNGELVKGQRSKLGGSGHAICQRNIA